MSLQPPKAKIVQEEEPTEDEYFEQELLDFLQMIESIHTNLNNLTTYTPQESKDEIQCIIIRFNKINFPMPSDQWGRVYGSLKKLSQIITSHSQSFESWTLLSDLFSSAKKFRTKYPTAQTGDLIRQKQIEMQKKQIKQKSMSQVLKFAKEFADDKDIKMAHTIALPTIKATMHKKTTIKQSKIKQIMHKKNSIKSESSIPNTNLALKSSLKMHPSNHTLITRKNEKPTQKLSSVDGSVSVTSVSGSLSPRKSSSTKSHHSRDRDRDHHSHRHRHRRSRSRSRSRERSHHRRSRHGRSYRSRSTSKTRDRDHTSDRERRSRNRSSQPLDKWGLPPPIHPTEYTMEMCEYQAHQRKIMHETDVGIDDMEKIPVVYGNSEICHGFNEGRCRLDPCKYQHVCWSCKGRGHPSSLCPFRPVRPYDAPPSHHKPCINWNMNGCPGGCLCADRHICLFCHGHHPMRHSYFCQWKFKREVEMKKRKPLDLASITVKDLQNLNPIGQYEHLRLNQNNPNSHTNTRIIPKTVHIGKYQRHSITPPPSMTIPTSFMAKRIEKEETTNVTEICVLYNTPSGCPAMYGKNDSHLHLMGQQNSADNNTNPNVFNGVCQLKHRCRECFGRHSFFDCPFRHHGIKCIIINDIVRYTEFPKRVYVVNGFVDRKESHSRGRGSKRERHSHSGLKSKPLPSPKIKITEVGLDIMAAQFEIGAKTLTKIVSSVTIAKKYPKMIIKELPTTISSQQVENKLRLLFDEKQIKNIVRIRSTNTQSKWIVSFLSVLDRQNAVQALSGVVMQARELKISIYGEDGSVEAKELGNSDKTLELVTKDEVPTDEHLYYCTHCDVGLFEYGLLRQHLLSPTHIAFVHRLHSNHSHSHSSNNVSEKVNVNECILCGTIVANGTICEHTSSTQHDNSNILMMLSLLRCSVNNNGMNGNNLYECQVCKMAINNSRQYFIHCNTDQHRGGLEEVIEPCPYFNKRGSGCQNEKCQFKHVCVGCNAITPIWRCKRCKNNEVCNMFNKGGAGCWYASGSCHRRHTCHYCHGSHPKVGCPKLYPNNKKEFNSQGQEVRPGSLQPKHITGRNHNQNNHSNTKQASHSHPPPPYYRQPPPPGRYGSNYAYPPPPRPPPHGSNYAYPPPPGPYPPPPGPPYQQQQQPPPPNSNYPYPPPPQQQYPPPH